MLATKKPRPRSTSAYMPQPAEVLSVRSLTKLEKVFTLRLGSKKRLHHQPGQFLQVSILGVGECPISICSSPTRPDTFELTVRRVGEVTAAIHRLEVGDVIGVRGPLGRGFDPSLFEGHDVLVVAGGCALAPARSLIQYVLDRRDRFGDFHVFYGARSPEELLFRDELESWQADARVRCLVTVDGADDTWRGHTGVVTRLFSQWPCHQPARTKVAVIGPPVMFKFVMLELIGRQIPERSIFCSIERRMKCGIGKCGHCQVNQLYACQDGPVFCYTELATVREAIR